MTHMYWWRTEIFDDPQTAGKQAYHAPPLWYPDRNGR